MKIIANADALLSTLCATRKQISTELERNLSDTQRRTLTGRWEGVQTAIDLIHLMAIDNGKE